MGQKLKIYTVAFAPEWPVGNCLILAAYNKEQAVQIAKDTIKHTGAFAVEEVVLDKPQVIQYLSGEY